MEQVILGGPSGTLPSYAGTMFAGLYAPGETWSSPITIREQLASPPGTLKNLRVILDIAPGAGTSWTFTVMVNGVASSLACTISDTDTSGQDLVNTASVVAGNTISLRGSFSGAPATCTPRWSCIFEGTNDRESTLPGGTATNHQTETRYIQLAGTCPFGTSPRDQAIAAAGTLKNLYIKLNAAPGAGDSFKFTVTLNGADTALTCTISGAVDTIGHDTTHTVAVVPGDTVGLKSEPIGTPTARNVQWGTTFLADTDKESIFLGDAPLVETAVRYVPLANGNAGSTTTEDAVDQPIQECSLSDLYMKLGFAPGPSKSWAFMLRKNNADTAITFTISDTATEGHYTASSVDFVDDDEVCLRITPAGTPYSCNGSWGILVKRGAAAAAGGSMAAKMLAAGLL